MAFPDPGSQQYYPSPTGPTYSSSGTDRASFTPIPQERSDSLPRVSLQGLETPRYPVDSTAGDIFKGIGNSLDTVVKAADTTIKDNLEHQIYAGVDKIRGQFGVDDATKIAGEDGGIYPSGNQTGKGIPMVLQRLGAQVQGLSDAAEAGMSNSYYTARLEVLSRQMREQYPGYRPEIDEMFKKATGIIPANALRTALNQDVDKLQNKLESKANEYQKFLVTNAEFLPQGYDKMDKAQVMGFVIDQKGFQHRMDEARKPLLTREGPNGEFMTASQRSEVGVRQFGIVADNVVAQQFNRSTEGMLTPAALQKLILDQQKPGAKPLDPTEQQGLAGQLDYYEKTIRSAILFQAIKAHQPGMPGNFRGDIGDPDKLTKVMDAAMEPIKMMKDSLYSQQGGLFGAASAIVKSTRDQEEARLMGQKPIAKVSAARAALGDQAVNLWLMTQDAQGQTPLSDLARSLNATGISSAAITPNGGSPMVQGLLDRAKAGKAIAPTEVQSYINMHTQAATNPDLIKTVPVQNRANTLLNTYTDLDQLYSKGVIKPEQYKPFLNMVASPAVTQGVVNMKDTNPEVLAKYTEFTNRAFASAYTDKAAELQSYVKSPFYEVTWNEKLGGIEVRFDRQKFPGADTSLVVKKHVDEFNQGLKLMAPIWKANGVEPADALKQVGLDLTAERNVGRKPEPLLGDETARKAKSQENIKKQQDLLKGRPSSALNFATEQNPGGPSVQDFFNNPTGGKQPVTHNLTDENLIGMGTTDIPDGVDPAAFIKALKNRP